MSKAHADMMTTTRSRSVTTENLSPPLINNATNLSTNTKDQQNDIILSKKTTTTTTSETSSSSFPPTPTMKECFSFALPALGIYAFPSLMSLIDASFIGRTSNSLLELAALGPAGSISDSSPLPLLFLSIGATNLIAKSFAKNDLVACRDVTQTSLGMGILGGIILAIGLYTTALPLAHLYCASTTSATTSSMLLVPLCARYVQIRALALPAVVVATIAQAICIGMRDTKTPLLAVALAAIFNFIGDYYLCHIRHQGLAGAAWATAASQVAAAGLLIAVLFRRGLLLLSTTTSTSRDHDNFHSSSTTTTTIFQNKNQQQQQETATNNNNDNLPNKKKTILSLLSFIPFLFVMGVKIGMHNASAATAASLGGAPAAAHTAIFAIGMLCFTFGDVGSSLAQAFLPPFATTTQGDTNNKTSLEQEQQQHSDNMQHEISRRQQPSLLFRKQKNKVDKKKQHVSFDLDAAMPTLKQLFKCTFTISATVVCIASSLLTIFGRHITRDAAVLEQMRATLPIMIAVLVLHATTVTLEGLLLARRHFRGLTMTYTGVALSIAILQTLVRKTGAGLVGVWACYLWFQASRIVTFSALGGLWNPQRWRNKRQKRESTF